MKTISSYLLIITIGVISASVIIFFAWSFFNQSGPEFVTSQGHFAQEPNYLLNDSLITITWKTNKLFDQNEVLFYDSFKKEYFGVGATSAYDEVTDTYTHTVKYDLSKQGEDKNKSGILNNRYSYQVENENLDGDKERIASKVINIE